jgi:hypothetical protein
MWIIFLVQTNQKLSSWTRLSSTNLFSMAQPAVYHSAVPSIATLHPNLPQSLSSCTVELGSSSSIKQLASSLIAADFAHSFCVNVRYSHSNAYLSCPGTRYGFVPASETCKVGDSFGREGGLVWCRGITCGLARQVAINLMTEICMLGDSVLGLQRAWEYHLTSINQPFTRRVGK